MFKQFFGLTFNPFDKEVEVDKLYQGEDLTELEGRLKYMLDNRGMGLIIGEPGMGKSTCLRKFAENANKSLYKVCYLPLTTLTVKDFYQAICVMLGCAKPYRKIDMFYEIQSAINSLYYDQRITPVFIVDEIHMASTQILDDLRILFNFKMDSANPFVLIMVGQPQIRNKLMLNTSYPLKQRIVMRYTMQGLKKEECTDYLDSRMRLAGCTRNVFTPAAIEAIYNISNGAPRVINNITTAALMYSAAKRVDSVDGEAVFQANIEIGA
ncbi:MAG: ExeA family protein [Anaerovoracaceae bacterium]